MNCLFCDVRINIGCMNNACGGSIPRCLDAEQIIGIYQGLRDDYWAEEDMEISENQITMGDCDADDVILILKVLDENLQPHGRMGTHALTCECVRDLDLTGYQEIAGFTSLVGFRRSDWTDEEASE